MWSVSVGRLRRMRGVRPGLIGVGLAASLLLAAPSAAEPETAPPKAEEAAPKAPKTDFAAPAAEKAPTDVMTVIYLGREYPEPLPLSYAEKLVTDKGIQGARLMLKEANQAGEFVGHARTPAACPLPHQATTVCTSFSMPAATSAMRASYM